MTTEKRVVAEVDCSNNTITYRDMTTEEIAEQDAITAQSLTREAVLLAKREAHELLVASARAKLVAGEPLTEEEAATIVL